MIIYVIKTIFCSGVLFWVYFLLLEKEKMHRFNRYYLLISLVVALVVPLIEINQQIPLATNNVVSETFFSVTETTFNTVSNTIEKPVHNNNLQPDFLLIGYLLVSTILLLRFARNLYQLRSKVSNNQTVPYHDAKLILLPQSIVSHSFMKYIFIAKEDYKNGSINETILSHELAHVQQKHSLDIIFIEVLFIVFWFNPFIYFYKKAIQLNHEFLADAFVLKKVSNVASYQYLLLQQVSQNTSYQLASQFNFSITKKRLLMMNKTTSFTKRVVKQLAIIPIIGSLVFVFSSKTIAQDTLKKITESVPVKASVDNSQKPAKVNAGNGMEAYFIKNSIGYSATDASHDLMDEYETIVKKYKIDSTNRMQSIFTDMTQQDKSRLVTIFKQMSIEQQVKQHVAFNKSLGPLKREVPTETQFNNFKKANIYGIWIDDKRVKNDVLNNYKASDFAQFDISKLYGAAKVGRNYTHQVNMMTKAYYQKYYDEKIAKKDEPAIVIRFFTKAAVLKS